MLINRHRLAALASVTILAAIAANELPAQAHDGHGSTPVAASLTKAQRRVIVEATKRYRDVDAAVAAGYLPTEECAALPGVGGMGYHYVNPTFASDAKVDPVTPEILLYAKDRKGQLFLAGVEYFVADADQDPSTDADRPTLFGHGFDGPMPGHDPGMPMHYDLHTWVYLDNPSGELAAWNPRVTCP